MQKPLGKRLGLWLVILVLLAVTINIIKHTDLLRFTSAVAKPGNVSEEETQATSYAEGEYKVGTDIPAGEYVLIGRESGSYFQISSAPAQAMYGVSRNDLFTSRLYITLKQDEYFQIRNCRAYAVADAPQVTADSGVLTNGMYKVGTDIPAGNYKIVALGGDAYAEIDNDSFHNTDSAATNLTFQDNRYLALQSGQYIILDNAKLYLNN